MGEGLLKCGKYQEAFKSYQKAVSLAKEQENESLPVYEDGLRNIKKILKGQ